MKQEEKQQLIKTKSYYSFMRDRNWRAFIQCKAKLEALLSKYSTKSEEEITKSDLLTLITYNSDYMRSLGAYNYYKEAVANIRRQLMEAEDVQTDE